MSKRLTQVLVVWLVFLCWCSSAPVGALVEIAQVDLSELSAIDLEGHVAVVAGSGAVTLLDVSNPRRPRPLGSLAVPDTVLDVALADGIAYIASGASGLRILDVSDPHEPVELAVHPTPPFALGVSVDGGIAYVTSGPSGLLLVDVSDPAAPKTLSAIDTPGSAWNVERVGSFAYVTDDTSLRVIDVSDPTAPHEVTSLPASSARSISVAGDRACFGSIVVEILDLSDPAAPVSMGSAEIRDGANWVAIDGDLCFAGSFGALRVFDIADPAAPIEVAALAYLPGRAVLDGRYAYLAASTRSFVVVDLSRPEHPSEIGALRLDGVFTWDIAVREGFVHTTDLDGLRILDARDPSALAEIGFAAGASGKDVEVVGDFAYVGAESGLHTVSVVDPWAPSAVHHLPGPPLEDLAVRGALVHAAGDDGLAIFDLSDPAVPVPIGSFSVRRGASRVAEEDGIVFLADRFIPLTAVDATDPANPVPIPNHLTDLRPEAIEVQAGFAYAVGRVLGAFHFAVFDVRDPSSPVDLGRLRMGSSERAEVEVASGRAFVPSPSRQTVRVIDLGDGAPAWLGGVETFHEVFDVEVADDLVYVLTVDTNPATRASTVQVFDLGPEYEPPLAVAIDIMPFVDSNWLIPASSGRLPVALLGSSSVDVTQVDLETLTFGPHRAMAEHRVHLRDLDGDGFEDLFARFAIDETGIALGDTTACLSGSMQDGVRLRGCDAIQTFPLHGGGTTGRCGIGFEAGAAGPAVALLARRRRRASSRLPT